MTTMTVFDAQHIDQRDVSKQFEGTQRSMIGLNTGLREFGENSPGPAPGEARAMVDRATSSLSTVTGIVQQAMADTDRITSDDTIWPDGRKRQAGERIQKANDDILAAASAAEAHLTMAEAELTVAAVRKVDPAEALAARMDMQLFTAGKAPVDAAKAISELAARDDAIGALAASEHGVTVMQAAGCDRKLIDVMQAAARSNAIDAARTTSDPDRRAAALSLDHVKKLRGSIDHARSIARVSAAELYGRHGVTPPRHYSGN